MITQSTNAIIIFIAGILAILVLIFAAYQIIKDATRTRQVQDVINVGNEKIDQTKFDLSNFTQIEGTDVLRANLQITQDYKFGSYSKEAESIQNYLFFNTTNKKSYWLKPQSNSLIVSTNELPENKYSEKPKDTVVFFIP